MSSLSTPKFLIGFCIAINKPTDNWRRTVDSIRESSVRLSSLDSSQIFRLYFQLNKKHWSSASIQEFNEYIYSIGISSLVEINISLDAGLYNSWNILLDLVPAAACFVAFLGAGDMIHPSYLTNAASLLEGPDELLTNIWFCECTIVDKLGSIIRTAKSPKSLLPIRPCVAGFFFPGTLLPRVLVQKYRFDEAFRIAGDYQLLLQLSHVGVQAKRLASTVYFESGGVSNTKIFTCWLEAIRAWEYVHPNSLTLPEKLDILLLFLRNHEFAWHIIKHFKSFVVRAALFLRQLIFFVMPSNYFRILFLRIQGHAVASSSYIHRSSAFLGFSQLSLGSHSIIGPNCLLDLRAPIIIRDNVSISRGCLVLTGSHDIKSPCFEFIAKSVRIDSRCVLFTRSIVLPGTWMQEGSVLSAGEISHRNIPENTLLINGRLSANCRSNLNYTIDTSFSVPKN